MIDILKVSGHSLTPFFQEGDFVLIVKIPFFLDRLKTGDAVVFHHPVFGKLIKLVEHIDPLGELIFVTGTQADSLDSQQLGPIPRSALLGKVIWRIKKPQGQRNL